MKKIYEFTPFSNSAETSEPFDPTQFPILSQHWPGLASSAPKPVDTLWERFTGTYQAGCTVPSIATSRAAIAAFEQWRHEFLRDANQQEAAALHLQEQL